MLLSSELISYYRERKDQIVSGDRSKESDGKARAVELSCACIVELSYDLFGLEHQSLQML